MILTLIQLGDYLLAAGNNDSLHTSMMHFIIWCFVSVIHNSTYMKLTANLSSIFIDEPGMSHFDQAQPSNRSFTLWDSWASESTIYYLPYISHLPSSILSELFIWGFVLCQTQIRCQSDQVRGFVRCVHNTSAVANLPKTQQWLCFRYCHQSSV